MASTGGGGSSGAKPLIVLDDSEDDEGSVEEVVVHVGPPAAAAAASSSSPAGQQKRKRGGSSNSNNSGDDSAVVDLTSGAAAAAFASSLSRRHGSDDEIEYVGSSGSAASAAQLVQYRAEAAASYVQFVGSTHPPAAAAGADAFGHYGGGAGSGSSDYEVSYDGSDREWIPAAAAPYTHAAPARRRSTPPQKKKRKSKKSESSPPPPPMEKGKTLLVPTGFDSLDMYYPHLKANDRSAVLHWLLPDGYTKKWVHEWRVAYEKKEGAKQTLWSMVSALSDELTGSKKDKGKKGESKGKSNDNDDSDDDDMDRKMPAVPLPKGKKGKENKKPAAKILVFSDDEDEQDEKKMADDGGYVDMKLKSVLSTPSIGPLSSEVLDTLRRYFRAHVGRGRYKAKLESIEPVDDNSGGLTCSVCCDSFNPTDTVPCAGIEELHFFCKTCFSSYATVTVQSGPVQSIVCPMPGCHSLFATADAKANLSAWDLLTIEHRETSRDRRVALAAKAVLHCECGAVAIITKEDVGNGRVACPGEGCGKRYCCKCGNDDHGTELCPPPAETVQWLDEHSKECPNCGNRIEKNGGCDHMTCSPPGGCGHEFWWTCGCPYKGAHRPGCQRLGEKRMG